MRISVTTLEAFRLWRDGGWMSRDELDASIRGEFIPTPRVRLGQAFGRILAKPDAHREPLGGGYACDGYRFEADVLEPAIAGLDYTRGVFEVKEERRYGSHLVVTKGDYLLGAHLWEFKTRVGEIDLARYARSYQWRFMADMLGAVAVRYRVYRLREVPRWTLVAIEDLPLYPYARMRDDCHALVEAFAVYVQQRGLESHLAERFEDRPSFEDSPIRPRRVRRPRVAPSPVPSDLPVWRSAGPSARHQPGLF